MKRQLAGNAVEHPNSSLAFHVHVEQRCMPVTPHHGFGFQEGYGAVLLCASIPTFAIDSMKDRAKDHSSRLRDQTPAAMRTLCLAIILVPVMLDE